MLRQALVLAAGRGRPIGDPSQANCLAEVGGLPLIARTLRMLRRSGVRRVGITVGYAGSDLRRKIEALVAHDPEMPGELAFFENPHWEKPNGLSVLAARSFVTEPTLLVMADQIAAPRLYERMIRLRTQGEITTLAVDAEVGRVFDVADATKVACDQTARDGAALKLREISKGLATYQTVSTGIFVLSPSLIQILAQLHEPSLTEGVASAAQQGLVEVVDVHGALWQDVDSPQMRVHADWLMRAYGDELDRPAIRGEALSSATDTLLLIERLLGEKDTPRYTLFNPGPVMTSTRVKAALVHHDVCHRDEDYTGVVRRLVAKLRPVFGATQSHEILLVTGSGTAAMEAALSSVVPTGRTLLTIENGAFGERLGEIAAVHGLGPHRLRLPWGQLPSAQAVAQLLDAHPDIAAVAMIHHETSVGVLNPVAEVGAICRARGRLLIVDAVSSLGAEDLSVQRDCIDLCFSSANKCLHGVAGVSFVCLSPAAVAQLAVAPARGFYLDLRRYRRAMEEIGQTPFTPAVSTFLALEAALDELAEQGGAEIRRGIYLRRRMRIRRLLTDLGFRPLGAARESSSISTLRVPAGLTPAQLYDRLKDRGFVIYKAKGALASDHIQVANMGELSDAAIDGLLQATAEIVDAVRGRDAPSATRLRSV